MKKYSKIFGCNIHNNIHISPLALKIIDTPEFQRLRYIKQLGLVYYVFPNAVHTRFEHSIGVYHLTNIMIEKIFQNYKNMKFNIPELSVDPIYLNLKIIELIKIAGLCHDIGHGPFSHIFDDILFDYNNNSHEERSCKILEIICKRELKDDIDEKEIEFMKSIIKPKKNNICAIYQIVSNNINDIDVDKFDYLERDSKNLGLKLSFNKDRLINDFIIDENGNIAFPKHCSLDIYELFHSRYIMYKKVYAHKTIRKIEIMYSDIFKNLDNIFKISKKIKNIHEFCKLTDNTLFELLNSLTLFNNIINLNLDEEKKNILKTVYDIYQNIEIRNLYYLIDEIICEKNLEYYFNEFKNNIIKKFLIDINDIIILKYTIGFTKKNNNIFDNIFLYEKKELNIIFPITNSKFSTILNYNKINEYQWLLIYKKNNYLKDINDEYYNYKKNNYKNLF